MNNCKECDHYGCIGNKGRDCPKLMAEKVMAATAAQKK